ncbi:MAG: hypothetical protein IPN89_15685 [Saprospiraceae bacterium]|nr:hypothetical protein [Saprospiraceae bacterium]
MLPFIQKSPREAIASVILLGINRVLSNSSEEALNRAGTVSTIIASIRFYGTRTKAPE